MRSQKLTSWGGLLLCLLIGYQNCSPFVSRQAASVVYPYESQPTFFVDVQLASKEERADRVVYTIDAAISNAADPTLAVAYIIRFSANQETEVCPRVNGRVTNLDNHVHHVCESALEPREFRVEVFVTNPDSENQSFLYVF